MQELKSRFNEENSPSNAIRELDQANNHIKPVDLCMSGKKHNLKHRGHWLSFYFPIKLIRGPPLLDPSSYGAGIDCLIHTDGLALD